MSILLADDDVQLATFLSKSLESEGYAVRTALDEGTVLAELKRQNYSLIILDLNFGQTDGLELLERLRKGGLETPIIVLSARNRVADRIQSLNLGADDYVTKPFSFQELSARTSALLRRKADPGLKVLRVEDLEVEPATRKVRRGEREIKLSPREFDLLHLLMRRSGETISRNTLLQECWGEESDPGSNLVDVYVNYLRKKIDSAAEPKLLFTVRGEGYRLGGPASLSPASTFADYHPDTPVGSAGSDGDVVDERFAAGVQQAPMRALVHSLAHDLAQPLTSVRCFLEVLALRKQGASLQPSEIKDIEQQADRAIALTKGISALVRSEGLPAGPWFPLDLLLNEVFEDFAVLLHSGFLTLQKEWDHAAQVTSSPLLRQLLVLLVAKVSGRNTRPLQLTIAGVLRGEHCHLQLRWASSEATQGPVPDAKSILAKDLANLQDLARSIGGELATAQDQPVIELALPAGPRTAASKDLVH
ncbi:MAG TPA: response regulator [Candidatus Angelobacter sp.]